MLKFILVLSHCATFALSKLRAGSKLSVSRIEGCSLPWRPTRIIGHDCQVLCDSICLRGGGYYSPQTGKLICYRNKYRAIGISAGHVNGTSPICKCGIHEEGEFQECKFQDPIRRPIDNCDLFCSEQTVYSYDARNIWCIPREPGRLRVIKTLKGGCYNKRIMEEDVLQNLKCNWCHCGLETKMMLENNAIFVIDSALKMALVPIDEMRSKNPISRAGPKENHSKVFMRETLLRENKILACPDPWESKFVSRGKKNRNACDAFCQSYCSAGTATALNDRMFCYNDQVNAQYKYYEFKRENNCLCGLPVTGADSKKFSTCEIPKLLQFTTVSEELCGGECGKYVILRYSMFNVKNKPRVVWCLPRDDIPNLNKTQLTGTCYTEVKDSEIVSKDKFFNYCVCGKLLAS